MASQDRNHGKARTHSQSRQICCACCGSGGAKILVTQTTELLIKKYAHPNYDMAVQSYPVGLCNVCKVVLYKNRNQDKEGKDVIPRKEWKSFKLEQISVPRSSSMSTSCPCPMCRCGHFNPVGVQGEKRIVCKPVINVTGGPMACEVQDKVSVKGKGICEICFQITGRGIHHLCSKKTRVLEKMGRIERSKSM